MQKAIFTVLQGLTDGSGACLFNSNEFGRLALNGGFEFTVRDRLLDPLHTKVNQAIPNDSIVSEYSKHGYINGKKDKNGKDIILLADMARLEGLMSVPMPPCRGIIELKANYSSQLSEIKNRTIADYEKWFQPSVTAPDFPYYYLHIIVEVDPDTRPCGYFPKYPRGVRKSISNLMDDIQVFFSGFNRGCTLYSITSTSQSQKSPLVNLNIQHPEYSTNCIYPGFSACIKTHFFLLEKLPVNWNSVRMPIP